MATLVVLLEVFLVALIIGFARSLVDESGRYRAGTDISTLGPPEPTEADRNASIDLSQQPVEKLFRLLAWELMREEKRPHERKLEIRRFQQLTELGCLERLVNIVDESTKLAKDVEIYNLNVTGTAGLYWLLHKYPEEHSWVWLIGVSQERVLRKVGHYFTLLSAYAFDDPENCLSVDLRSALMNALAVWRRQHSSQLALVWNGVAFGVLGDVTAWREMDENGETADEPGGPPPNVSWSENIIFANMWVASVQKWLEHNAADIQHAVASEIHRAQVGLPTPNSEGMQFAKGSAFSSFEFLRRQIFHSWPLDKGLLRGILRHVVLPTYGDDPPSTLIDFGAGGGSYSEWLNETGLVQGFAVDAARSARDITGGRVMEADVSKDVQFWQNFDWVLCLDLGAHLSPESGKGLLRNVRKYATKGLVMSWPSDVGSTTANPLSERDFVELVEFETGFKVDWDSTQVVRTGCETDLLAKSVTIFRAKY